MTKFNSRNIFAWSGAVALAAFVAGAAMPAAANHVIINQVDVDFDAQSIAIIGGDFDADTLWVSLGGDDITPQCLAPTAPTATVIVCDFSGSGLPGDGDYLLTVATSHGKSGKSGKSRKSDKRHGHSDEYDLTIGAVGPQGEQGKLGDRGPQGDQGVQGKLGDTGAQGAQGKLGPAGADSTVPGPRGPQGIQGEQGPGGVIGPNSVGSAEVIDNSLSGSDIANGTIGSQDISTIQPGQIAPKPFEFEMFTVPGSGTIGTRWAGGDFVVAVTGFQAINGDIQENGAGNPIFVYPFISGGVWRITFDFRSHLTHERWRIWAMAVRREMTVLHGGYGNP